MNKISGGLLLTAVLAAASGCDRKSSGGADAVVPIGKHSWGSFPPGSFARFKVTTREDISGTITQVSMSMLYTLKEVTATEAVLEVVTEFPGAPSLKDRLMIPLKGPDPNAPQSKSGSEVLEVSGKKLTCDWTESDSPNPQKKSVRTYTDLEVPGFLVKRVLKDASMTRTMELVDFGPR